MTAAVTTGATPLLSPAEINTLIDAATAGITASPQAIHQGSRSGDLTTRGLGAGTDAADLRNYYPGDDTRHIDWRASARSTTTMLRTWHADRAIPFVVLLDRRASMRFGSRQRLKVTQAARMALSLLAREARAGREVGVLILDHPGQWIPPAAGIPGLMRLIPAVVAAAPPVGAQPPQLWRNTITALVQRLDADADIVLISDFHGLESRDKRLLLTLGQRFLCRAIQVTDPLETHPEFPFPVTLSWADKALDIDSPASPALATLVAAQAGYQSWLQRTCRRAGIPFEQLSTTQDDLLTPP